MRFLDGAATTAEIVKLTESSGNVRIAVAFWGDGAMAGLRLGRKGQSATIVCNLKSGATNPFEIEKLMATEALVRQCDSLHGKVYLFDECVIVGSSNASANGLALQGNELAGWSEANILTSDRSIYEAAERWIDGLDARDITPLDLEEAKIEFAKRRRAVARNRVLVARPTNVTKILNVLDARDRLRNIGNGRFESGFWFRPDLNCEVIRVFRDPNGVSIHGGRIRKVREEVRNGQEVKIFEFVEDTLQRGKPPPPRFRANGCKATFE